MTKLTGRGELYRIDPATNQTLRRHQGCREPFANGDGMIWAYNLRTSVVNGIDPFRQPGARSWSRQDSSGAADFAFGAGDIWQYVRSDGVNSVRRIDPDSKRPSPRYPVALHPYNPDRLRFVAGPSGFWVNLRRHETGFAGCRTHRYGKQSRCRDHTSGEVPDSMRGVPEPNDTGTLGWWARISTFCSNIHRVRVFC